MKTIFSAKSLCRAAIVAALYAALTYAFGQLAFGPVQVRPAEALCLLPLFFVESIPGLYIGCMLANLISGYGPADIFLGSLVTLSAAACTFLIGKAFKSAFLKIAIGGIFPVLFNAAFIPLVFMIAATDGGAASAAVYFGNFFSILLTQVLWVYGLGIPVYLFVAGLRKKGFTPLL